VIEPPDPRDVAALVKEHSADLVVIGLPLGLRGDSGDQAAAAIGFRDEVATLVEIPVQTYDERLTTRMAARTAREGATAAEDSLAAAHLLEGFLAARSAPSSADDGEAEG
jgi:putative transcription antitermination factor YqgF